MKFTELPWLMTPVESEIKFWVPFQTEESETLRMDRYGTGMRASEASDWSRSSLPSLFGLIDTKVLFVGRASGPPNLWPLSTLFLMHPK